MSSLYLRNALPEDVRLLFKWANDEATRANAFTSRRISYEEHLAWFDNVMNNPNEVQYILMLSGIDEEKEEPIGQIRLSISSGNCKNAEIEYSISKAKRGKGYGKAIISLIKDKVMEEYPFVEKLIAKVKPSNVASFYCFTKNGFVEKFQQLECDIDAKEINMHEALVNS